MAGNAADNHTFNEIAATVKSIIKLPRLEIQERFQFSQRKQNIDETPTEYIQNIQADLLTRRDLDVENVVTFAEGYTRAHKTAELLQGKEIINSLKQGSEGREKKQSQLMMGRRLRSPLNAVRCIPEDNVKKSQEKQATVGSGNRNFYPGDSVWVRKFWLNKTTWIPGIVLHKLANLTYMVQVDEYKKLWKRHVDHLLSHDKGCRSQQKKEIIVLPNIEPNDTVDPMMPSETVQQPRVVDP
ncbi:hypothetical protein HELRODRAFT_175842 [Helobdella robusta]|uniref:Uncharacterized protein n=1 Tax=Helobdella robusta TaxID=6412 RepID=T1F9R4_HELRO|nr:hypothetical protein HELRODRAFT_175842 [Helobdella robusta]ESO00421.1 hypothetical protein HELRODRAFT_175842 [Helobdella robusta]